MSDSLSRLENEAEASRERLATGLAALRSPDLYAELAHDVKQTIVDAKDSLVDDTKKRARSVLAELADAAKEKAIANPTAAAVISTGLLWHFLRNPPVVAILIGGGLFSLLRTPSENADPAKPVAAKLVKNLRRQTGALSDAAADAGAEAFAFTKAKAKQMGAQAQAASQRVVSAASSAVDDVNAFVENRVDRIGHAVARGGSSDSFADEEADLGPRGSDEVDHIDGRIRNRSTPFQRIALGAAGIALVGGLGLLLTKPVGSQIRSPADRVRAPKRRKPKSKTGKKASRD